MADERKYIVPTSLAPRVYRTLSGYLQSIACYAPSLAPASLPSKVASASAAKKAAAKQQAEEKKETHWIFIRLVDDQKKPIAGEPYKIELPDGKVIEGRLDRDGTARHAKLEPGSCKVTFPWRDAAWWEAVPDEQPPAVEPPPPEPLKASLSATEAAWLDIQLRDSEQQPVDGEPYRILSSEGKLLAQGALDDQGFAHIEGLRPGMCKVVFPLRDAAWWQGDTQVQPPESESPAEPVKATLRKI